MKKPAAQDILNRLLVARLPSPPQTLLTLLELCQSDDVGLADIADLIGADPALAGKVLSVAHSAAYHRADARALTLLQATNTLGTALIKVLVISESVFQTFNDFRQIGGTDLRQFWKHSLSVAVLARELAQRQDPALAEEAYLAGLLHDVGRLALLAAVPEHYQPLFGSGDEDNLCDREQHTLDISHAEAGAWLLERWHLSPAIADSVLHHHQDAISLAGAPPLTRVMGLAHLIDALPAESPQATDRLSQAIHLAVPDIDALRQKTATQVIQIARDLGIDITAAAPDQPGTPGQPVVPAPAPASTPTPLVQQLLNRSVLNEMAMTLISLDSTQAALTSLRQHASALMQLEDALFMLLRDNQHTAVPVSMNEGHRSNVPMSFDVAADAAIGACITQRQVVFAGQGHALPSPLCRIMGVAEMVFIPVVTAQRCLGVLAATVPPELSQHLNSQGAVMQAFGVYAGLALSRRHQADQTRSTQANTQSAAAQQARQLALRNMTQAIGQMVSDLACAAPTEPLAPLDLRQPVQEVLQMLQQQQVFPASVRMDCALPERAVWVQGSRSKIAQALLILLKNACESMPEGGQIQVDAGALVQRAGAMFTVLTVLDNGCGLTQALQAQVYEPLPRQSAAQPALALNVVNHLVETMDGKLKFSTGADGTRFDVLLPCARKA